MKMSALLMALAAALPTVYAADDPPPVRPAARPDHLTVARQAIDAGNWSVAQRELAVALKEQPQNADVHNLLGYTYRKRSSPDLVKAFEHYNIALKFNPQHRGAHEYIGEAYLIEKRPAEAERHLAELEKICGNRDCEEYRDLAKSIADYKARN